MVLRRTFSAACALPALLAGAGCGRSGVMAGEGSGPPPPDPGPVVFESVASSSAQIGAGSYELPVSATLRNDGAATATGVRISLSFRDPSGDRGADFVAREVAWPGEVAAGDTEIVQLLVDVSPGADVAETIEIDGNALYTTGGDAFVTPTLQKDAWTFDSLREFVVDTTDDSSDSGDGVTSLREAIDAAAQDSGRARIRFSPTVFPPADPPTTTITIESELPTIDGNEVIIDGTGAGVRLGASLTLYASEVWMLSVATDVVVHRLTFDSPGSMYPVFNLTGDTCNGGIQDGGAIQAESGSTLVVDRVVFDDSGDPVRRNCYASTVRTRSSSGPHRIVNSEFLQPVGDALNLQGDTVEVSRNRVIGARDDGILLDVGSGATRVQGNLITDTNLAAILVIGASGGALQITHNTFARNDHSVRSFNARSMTIRNNASLNESSSAYNLSSDGQNSTISHGRVEGSSICTSCSQATYDTATVITGTLGVTDGGGDSWSDYVPISGSTLIDSGLPLYDVNGAAPGQYTGAGPDIGASERP